MHESLNTGTPIWAMLLKGGWVMLPIIACSLVAVTIIIERIFWGPRRSNVLPPAFISEVKRLLVEKRYDEILGLCRGSENPLAHIVSVALQNACRPREQLVEALEFAGKREAVKLQKYLGTLSTIATIGPLLGLLGTVFGMISSFSVIGIVGIGDPQALSGGIAEALITTASGLIIAIPTLVFHRFFLFRTRQFILEMEEFSLWVIDQLLSKETIPPAIREFGPRAV